MHHTNKNATDKTIRLLLTTYLAILILLTIQCNAYATYNTTLILLIIKHLCYFQYNLFYDTYKILRLQISNRKQNSGVKFQNIPSSFTQGKSPVAKVIKKSWDYIYTTSEFSGFIYVPGFIAFRIFGFTTALGWKLDQRA